MFWNTKFTQYFGKKQSIDMKQIFDKTKFAKKKKKN